MRDEFSDDEDAALDAALHRLLIRRKHGSAHAWVGGLDEAVPAAPEQAPAVEVLIRRKHGSAHARAGGLDEPEPAPAQPAAAVEVTAPPPQPEYLRLPRELDRGALLQALAIKDALIQQLESALLMPPPDQSVTVQMSRRAQALVANARRREAVLSCKLKALSREVYQFRQREVAAAQLNRALKHKLKAALTDLDAVALRREVRTLRADLEAALAREAALHKEMLVCQRHLEVDRVTISAHGEREQRLRDDLDYMRRMATNAMNARAHDAMGVPHAHADDVAFETR